MADQVIGKLKLDISDVERKVDVVNKKLKEIGVGVKVDLSKSISDEVKKQLDSVLKEIKGYEQKMSSAVDKVIDDATKKAGKKVDTQNLKEAIDLWKQYYAAMTKAQQSENNGNKSQAEFWRGEAAALKEKASALREEASLTKELEQAKRRYNATIAAGHDKQAAQNVREQTKANKELQSTLNDIAKAREKAQQIAENKSLKDEQERLNAIIDLYRIRNEMEAKASQYLGKGNFENANLFMGEAENAQRAIDAVAKLYPELDKLAQANSRVAESEIKRQEAANNLHQKQDEENYRQKTEAINEYADALVRLYSRQAEFNNNIASGQIKEGTQRYIDAKEAVDRCGDAVKEAGKKLESMGIDANAAVSSMDRVRDAADRVVDSENRLAAADTEGYLARATHAYNTLTDAIKNYNISKRAGDEQGMAKYQAIIDAQMQEVGLINQAVASSNIEASVKEKILMLTQRCATAEREHASAAMRTVSTTSDLSSAVNGLVTRYMSLLAVIRLVKNVLGDMIEYVSEYYDKMNEIRIITGSTESEAERLGETYRNLAESMSVSSLDMADAAIYFTRQGLGAQEIEKRLKSTTMYAKTANIEFERAAELITAVVNSMNLMDEEAEDGRTAAQRVADVFLKVGDNAATSGEEIGEAMQKAAASAGTFGVQFEWLAAYIATVSETTRQEARTIGTAFNTIIARLHQIKQTGYNSDDETKINDIAKALANVDIALMDQSGEWRDMTDIMEDIASKWDQMDDKTKSYIATTMAGVKQQNVFLALMNDMSKGVEGGSRAWELYGLAVDSAGTATEKYAIYEESATAAQERLTVAQEKFYALLEGDTLKGWYELLAKIVTGITNATKATGGLNITLPVLIGLVTTFAIVASNAAKSTTSLATSLKAFASSHPVVLGITAMIAVFAALSAAQADTVDSSEIMAENFSKAAKAVEENASAIKNYQSLQGQIGKMSESVGNQTHLTNEQLETYNSLLDELSSISPNAAQAVENLRNNIGDQKDAVKTLNDELQKNIQLQRDAQVGALIQKYANWTPGSDVSGTQPENIKYMANWDTAWQVGADANEQMYNALIAAAEAAIQQIDSNVSTWDELTAELGGIIRGNFNAHFDTSGMQEYLPEEMLEEITRLMWQRDFGDADLTSVFKSRALNVADQLFGGALSDLIGGNAGQTNTLSEADFEKGMRDIWRKYFGDISGGKDVIEAITNDMTGIVDDVVSSLSTVFDDVDKSLLKEYLLEAIMGEDMELSTDEYKQMGTVISQTIDSLWENGMALIGPEVKLRQIARELFGQDFVDIMAMAISDTANAPGMVDKISDAYMQLLSAGFSQDTILSLFADMTNDDTLSATGAIMNWANAVSLMIGRLKEKIAEAYTSEDGTNLIESLLGTDEYGKMDLELGKVFSDLIDAGTAYEDIFNAISTASSHEEMIANLRALLTMKVNPEVPETISDIVKEIKAAEKEVKAFDDVLDKLNKGEAVSFSDLLDLAEAHPQLLAMINDTELLKDELTALKNLKMADTIEQMKDWVMNDEEAMSWGDFAEYQSDAIKTLGDLIASEDIDAGVKQQAQNYVNTVIAMFLDATGEMENVGDDWLKTFISSMFGDANMDLINRKVIDAAELVKAGWEDAGEGIATVFTSTFSAGDQSKGADYEWNKNIVIGVTPIMPDGTVLSPDALEQYIDDLLRENADVEDLLTADKVGNGGKGLIIDVSAVADDESFDEAYSRIDSLLILLHKIHELLFEQDEPEKSWLEQQVEAANAAVEADWAKSNGYVEQIDAISRSLGEGGEEGARRAYEQWNAYDETMRKSIADTYPAIAQAMLEIERAISDTTDETRDWDKAAKGLNSSLDKASRYANAKYFTSTYQAIQKLAKGTVTATDAFETFNKEVKQYADAYDEITKANDKIADGTELVTSDVDKLASALGMTTQEVIDDFPGAVEMLEQLRQAGIDAYNELNREATLKILGMSESDFSELESDLLAVQADAQATIDLLKATGQWEVVTEDLPQEGKMWDPKTGTWQTFTTTAQATFLKPTNNNPFGSYGGGSSGAKKSSGGGGGGGGGGNKDKENNKNTMTEVERMLDRMSQRNEIQEYQRTYYEAQNKYYNQTGQLQGVIAYTEREIDLLKEQNGSLEENISLIEEQMDQKREELAALSTTDEEYEEVADDLDKLQKAHQNYSSQLINNKTDLDSLAKSMKEVKDKIRDMEINLRNTILKAIEDREKRNEDMLNAEIEMENTILDLITKRYEKERDEIINTTNDRIDLLNKEKDLLADQLRLRKEQSEEEDKLTKLKELEVKYQRIVADPTRQKEAASIRKDIESLREEMAWDAAEKEVKAQQDSIDQQVTNLNDYIEYVEDYYEELFKHPVKLIEEMKEIMSRTDDEIIQWLIENDEEYAKATDNTQTQMVTGWQSALDQMHGVIQTHWDEVEAIISQGDDYIIEFLKENTEDYRTAGKLQAEAYVDEWKQQLKDLELAHEKVTAKIADTYDVIEKADGDSGSSGSGSGGSGSGGGNKKKQTTKYGYTFTDNGKTIESEKIYDSTASAITAGEAKKNTIIAGYRASNQYGKLDNVSKVTAYKRGGVAMQTGLAWIDGGDSEYGERILSPYQTKLFETMVAALERASRISVAGMSNYGDLSTGNGVGQVSVGDIVVNVENLDTDDDYEELAEKVSNILVERIGRTAVVGGMRINAL